MVFVIAILIFAGAFYSLMRLGCGARLVHGLAPPTASVANSDADPVCGMTVGAETTLTLAHDGRTYRFCSATCRKRFRRHPQAFLVETTP